MLAGCPSWPPALSTVLPRDRLQCPPEATTHLHRTGQHCTQRQTGDERVPQQELGNGENPHCGAMACGPGRGVKPKGWLVIHCPGDLHPSATSGHRRLGSGCSIGGARPGADGLAQGRCGEDR